MSDLPFPIDIDEEFERLASAPIIEAVIHWIAQPTKPLEPNVFLEQLRDRLPDYPSIHPQHELKVNHQVGPEGSTLNQSRAWQSFQLATVDQRSIAQFGRNGLTASRLAPYQRWDSFRDEAFRLWQVFRDLANPPELQRIGVRYVNLIPVGSVEEAGKLLTAPPSFPGPLPLSVDQFMYQTTFGIPGRDYSLNLIQTIQPASPNAEHGLNLIVDIDIFSTSATVAIEQEVLDRCLAEMRWIKNKTFFGIFTESAINQFRK